MTTWTDLPTAALVRRCHSETGNYHRGLPHDDAPCLELLRRAIADREQAAYGGVYEVYYSQVVRWVLAQPSIAYISEDGDYLANMAFERFFRFMTAEKLAGARLADVLAYLRRCASAVVIDTARSGRRHETMSDAAIDHRRQAPPVDGPVIGRMAAGELVAGVLACCEDDRERVMAWRYLADRMRPREIQALHGDLFPTVREVYRSRDALVKRLRRQYATAGSVDAWLRGVA